MNIGEEAPKRVNHQIGTTHSLVVLGSHHHLLLKALVPLQECLKLLGRNRKVRKR